MATYELTSPTGQRFRVTAPDTASEQEVMSFFRTQSQQQAEQPQYAVPDYMARVLDEGGVDESTRTRLLNTGITPGTAPEWAAAHIQANKSRGQEVSQRQQEAIFDLYKRESGRTDLSSRDFLQEIRTRQQQEEFETLPGRATVAAKRVFQMGTDIGANTIGMIAPETGQALAERGEEVFGTATAPNAAREFGLNLGPEALKLVAAASLGPSGLATFYGTQGAGSTRRKISQLRDQGKDISTTRELLTAGAVGGVEAVSGFVGGKIFKSMGSVVRGLSPEVRQLLNRGDKKVIWSIIKQALSLTGHGAAEGGEEGITQGIENKILQGVDPEVALTDGMAEAGLMGFVLSPFGAHGIGINAETNVSEDTQTQTQISQESIPVSKQLPSPVQFAEREVETAKQQLEAAKASNQVAGPERVFQVTPEGQIGTEEQLRAQQQEQQPQAQEQSPTQEVQPEQFFETTPEKGTIPTERRTHSEERAHIDKLIAEGNTELAQQEITRLRKEVRMDPKGTGLLNDTAWNNDLKEQIPAEPVKGQSPRLVASADFANLGLLNTVQGHQAADIELSRVAEVANKVFGEGNVYRTGGDELSVMFPEGTKRGEARRLLRQFEKEVGTSKIVPTASTFISTGLADVKSQADLETSLKTAEDEAEARKAAVKTRLGEPTSISKDEAARLAQEAKQQPFAEQEQVRRATIKERFQAVKEAEVKLQQEKQRYAKARTEIASAPPLEGTDHKSKFRLPTAIEEWITPLSSRIRKISPRIFNRLMRMEFDSGVTRETLKRELHQSADKLTEALGGRGSDKYRQFTQAVFNNDQQTARELLPPELRPELDKFFTTFRNLFDNMRSAGITIGDLGENYWPRYVKNYKEFKKVFGDDLSIFEEAWDTARRLKGKRVLSSNEKAEIANSVVQGYGPRKPGQTGISNARQRTISQLNSSMLGSYVDPFEAAFRYIDATAYAAERSKFLGKNAQDPDSINESVGALISKESENLSPDQQDQLHDLLAARFTADILKPSAWSRNFKQIVYLSTLGQFRSALTQLTDAAFTAANYGVKATVKGIKSSWGLTDREHRIVMEDMGIHDHGEEFKDVGKLARATDWVMRKTGFKIIDRFGKETRANAALESLKTSAIKPGSKGYKQFESTYRPILGDEFDSTAKDLREGKITENVKYLTFLEVTRLQPVVTSQMPARYLQMPNGRIFYTLKTFTLTQLDLLRNDIGTKLATKGQRRAGLNNLARYLTYYGLVGLGIDLLKDLIRGEKPTPDTIPDRVIDTMLGLIGLNRYTTEKAWSKPSEAAINFVAPPLSWIDYPWQDLTSNSAGLRSIRHIPIIGELLYYWAPFGRGFQLNKEERVRDYRKRLEDLRTEAKTALRNNDMDLVRSLLMIYNERRKQGPGDGRKTSLGISDLRSDIRRGGEEPTFGEKAVNRLKTKVGIPVGSK